MNDQGMISTNPETAFNQAKKLMGSAPEKALNLLTEAQSIAVDQQMHDLVCEMYIYLSRHFRFQGRSFESVEQLNKVYRYLNRYIPHNHHILAHIYKEFGSIYSDGFEDHETALNYSLKSIQLNIEEIRPHLFNNIGSHYISLKKYDKASFYLKQGQQLCQSLDKNFILCFIYENFGNLFRFQEKYPEAIKYYQKGLESARNIGPSSENQQSISYIQCFIQTGLAKVYLNLKQLDQAAHWTQQTHQIATSAKLPNALSMVYLLEGQLLLAKNQVEKFEALFHTSFDFCAKKSFYTDQKTWLERIIHLYENQQKYAEALAYSKQIISIQEDQVSKTKSVNLSKVLESKEMEILKLEDRNRRMQIQKDQLEQFAYIVAHDLKTPLTNISNFIGLFYKKFKAKIDEQNQTYLNYAMNSSKQLHKMLDDLLQYITVKEVNERPPLCDVEQILNGLMVSNSKQIKQKQAKIEYNELPKVRIHDFHLKIILDNLIRNALKFSEKQKAPHIIIQLKDNKKEYAFSVSDNGIGIKQEYHQRIFDVFRRLDKVNYKGTGIGLSICKKIIQIYGGKIWVSDSESGGTSFHFNIPKIVFDTSHP